MRAAGQYVIAGLLVLASVPIYHYIYRRAVRPDVPPPVVVAAKSAAAPTVPQRFISMVQTDALAAMRAGRARCVAGVVYRTSEHVIEPWPGHVQCRGDDDAYTVVDVSGL